MLVFGFGSSCLSRSYLEPERESESQDSDLRFLHVSINFTVDIFLSGSAASTVVLLLLSKSGSSKAMLSK